MSLFDCNSFKFLQAIQQILEGSLEGNSILKSLNEVQSIASKQRKLLVKWPVNIQQGWVTIYYKVFKTHISSTH